MKKRILSLILAVVLLLGCLSLSASAEDLSEKNYKTETEEYQSWVQGENISGEYSSSHSFTDVKSGAYYEKAVQWAVENGITAGISATVFSPNTSCTRAQAVTFLWRAAGKPAPSGSTRSFSDVKTGSYYEKAVAWAVEKGITSGTSATRFSPDATCTRAQIVTFQWRAAGFPSTGAASSFWDVSSNDYYANAVAWAVEQGITSGTSATRFSPNAACTRAQIVSFMYRDAQNHKNDHAVTFLEDMDYYSKDEYVAFENTSAYNKDVLGNTYSCKILYPTGDGLIMDHATNERDGEIEYLLNGEYKTLTGTLYLPYECRAVEEPTVPSLFKVYGDGKLLYTAPDFRKGTIKPVEINVDISDVMVLKIAILGIWSYGWGWHVKEPMICAANLAVSTGSKTTG